MIGSLLSGRYQLVQGLGEGPVFNQFVARDQSVGRDVSIRIVRAEYSRDLQFIDRLRSAVTSVARVQDPSLEALKEVHVDGNVAFVVGESSKGQTLADRLQRLSSLAVPLSVQTAIGVCEGLAALHAFGIAHGDVCATNVVIQQDESVRVQLGGIWSAYSASAAIGSAVLPGMAGYLAPEISEGGQMPSPASDAYAVGILLFEMLAGRRPYLADTALSTVVKHSTASTPTVRDFNPSVPTVLNEIIRKSMQKDPAHRYQNAKELLDDLRLLSDALRFGKTLTWPIRPGQSEPIGPVAPKLSAIRGEAKPTTHPDETGPREELVEDGVPWVIKSLIIFFSALLVFMIGGWIIFNLKKPKMVEVPKVQGYSLAEATEIVEKLGLKVNVAKREPNERVQQDHVLEIWPDAGRKVFEGSTLSVTLSSGSRFVATPDLRGRTLDEVRSLLSSLNLELDESVREERNSHVPKGMVVSQVPEPRTRIERLSKVRVTVSAGEIAPVASGAAPPTNESYMYDLTLKITGVDGPVLVRVDMTDARETRTIYEARHDPNDVVPISANGYGSQVDFRVFYDDQPVLQRTVKANERSGGTP